ATAPDYRTDVARAQLLGALVREGHASNLVEASIRLAVGSDAVSTVLVGYSSVEHLEAAAAAVNRGPLPQAALDRLTALWSGLAGRGARRGTPRRLGGVAAPARPAEGAPALVDAGPRSPAGGAPVGRPRRLLPPPLVRPPIEDHLGPVDVGERALEVAV